MKLEDKYSSFIINCIENWLLGLPADMFAQTEQETHLAIYRVTNALGYGEPFDREQKTINAILLNSLANKPTCQTVWDFYHEIKFADFSMKKWEEYTQLLSPSGAANVPTV